MEFCRLCFCNYSKFWITVIRKFGATIIFFNLDGGTTQKREGSDSGKKIVTENVKLKVFSDSFSPIYLKNCHKILLAAHR